MATAVWTGSLSLGLVVVPVRLYPAIHKKTVRFHELDRAGRRVRHVRVAEPDPERSRVIDVQQFVDVAAVDPIYFESRYYVVPDREWSAPFRVLRQALAAADRMALAWFTLRSRRYLSAIRAYGDVMLLTTMVHADEVVAAEFVGSDADASPTERELKMA